MLTVTEILRKTGVVGKFVEYFGEGLAALPLADRATLGNMSPEYGATCGFFPVDELTLDYLRLTGRPAERIALVEAYCKENLLWHDPAEHATYSQVVELDLGDVEPSLAGPRRPQDRVPLAQREGGVPRGARHVRRRLRERLDDRAVADTFPATDPTTEQQPGGEPMPDERRPVATGDAAPAHHRVAGRRRRVRARPRRRRDRRDHVVHEHVEPAGDGRRRPAREEGRRARAARASRG